MSAACRSHPQLYQSDTTSAYQPYRKRTSYSRIGKRPIVKAQKSEEGTSARCGDSWKLAIPAAANRCLLQLSRPLPRRPVPPGHCRTYTVAPAVAATLAAVPPIEFLHFAINRKSVATRSIITRFVEDVLVARGVARFINRVEVL